MKMITEHLGEIIIALVIFALLCTMVWAIRGPMDAFFDNVADSLAQPTEPEIDNSGEATEPGTMPPYTYTVVYHANGGTGAMEPSSFTSGAIVNLPANQFTKTGYTFSGWATTDSGEVIWSDEAAVEDLAEEDSPTCDLYAIWRANPYRVEFYANGGTGTMTSQQFAYDAAQNLAENVFKRDGYTFKCWNTKENGSGTNYADRAEVKSLSTGDPVKLYAQWEKVTYNLSFNLVGGKLPDGSKTTYTIEDEAFVLPTPTKDGYTFAGWTGSNGMTPQVSVTVPKGSMGDKTYTANWVVSVYDITYHLNGGTQGSGAATSHDVTKAVTLPTPTKTGYTFGGWYEKADFSGSAVTQIAKGTTGNKEYWAKWVQESFSITYHLNGGTQASGAATSYHVATAVTLPTPTKNGYTFGGWYENKGLSGTAVAQIAKGSTGNKEYWAKWVPETYSITYHLNGGTQANGAATSYNIETAVKLPKPTKTGYAFVGWYTSSNLSGTAVTQIAKGTTGNKTYYAKWELAVPILASGSSWFRATNESVTRSAISSIAIADTYSPSGEIVDSWDASEAKNKSVIAYVEDDGLGNGTYKLTIAGNGYGQVYANQYSGCAFGHYRDEYIFTNLTAFNDPNKIFNTSLATEMVRMFMEAEKLVNIDAGHWDVSNVKDMTWMFYSCKKLNGLDVSKWNMEKVESLRYTFDSCSALTSLNTTNWTFKNLKDLYSTFDSCSKLVTLDVSKWDVSTVETMKYLFDGCSSLTSLNVANWNTGSVTDMAYMFNKCGKLTTIPVGNWDTSSVTNMGCMFEYCYQLASLDVATKTVTNSNGTYTAWDVSKVTNMYSMFDDCYTLTTLDVSDWQTDSLVTASDMFLDCTGLKTLDVSGWNMANVESMYCMFMNCESLEVIDVSKWITTSLTTVTGFRQSNGMCDRGFFENCTSLKSVNLGSWDMSKITNNAHMFFNCTSLESIVIPASAKYISPEFAYNCSSLKTVKFMHGANDELIMPEKGGAKSMDWYPSSSVHELGYYSDGGAFYVPSKVTTTVASNGNAAVQAYDWAAENRVLN